MASDPFRLITTADLADHDRGSDGRNWHGDCACEASNVAVSGGAGVEAMAGPFRRCPALFEDGATVPEARIVFNPLAGEGVSLLGAGTARLLDLVDGTRTTADLAAALGQPPAAVTALLTRLQTARLIYAGAHPPAPAHRPPTHLGVWLHVTNQCNLRCTYCYVSKTAEHLPPALGRQALDQVFAAARQRGMTELTLKFAGGEALLEAPTIWALHDYAQAQAAPDLQVRSIILTNGTPLKPALLPALQARRFQLAVSLDGLGAAHDTQRPFRGGQPSFRQAQAGLDHAVTAGLDVSVSVVVGPGNLPGLADLIDYLLDRELRFTLTFVRDNAQASLHLADHDAALITAMEAAYDRIARRPPPFSLLNAALDRVQLEHPHFAACGLGESYIVITHTGALTSCQMLLDRPLGHVRRGDPLTQIAAHPHPRPPGPPDPTTSDCRTCQWRFRCAGGCPVVTFQATGRVTARSPFCGVYQTLIPRLIALEGLRLARYGQVMAASA